MYDELFTTVNNYQVTNPKERWEILVEIRRENDWEPDYNQYGNNLPAPALSQEWCDTKKIKERVEKERLRYRRHYARELGSKRERLSERAIMI